MFLKLNVLDYAVIFRVKKTLKFKSFDLLKKGVAVFAYQVIPIPSGNTFSSYGFTCLFSSGLIAAM